MEKITGTEERDIEVKHGEVTGRELFRVKGVDMAWVHSREAAIDVARRIEKAVNAGLYSGRAAKEESPRV